MTLQETLTQELDTFNELLVTIPFTDGEMDKYFLNIYKLNYKELNKYLGTNGFPIDSNKLLKLSISLGNLLKSLQLDEEMYVQQQQQQNQLNSKLNNLKGPGTSNYSNPPSNTTSTTSIDPFGSPKHFINSFPTTNQPLYQIKFLKNLLIILKNFDIGNSSGRANKLDSSSTLNQYNSPIKLNSKQLLIEKLEINISLDCLFIYKTLLQLLIRIYIILRDHIDNLDNLDNGGGFSRDSTSGEISSIFSSNSNTSSDSYITNEEYFKILNQILGKISTGLIEPLLKYLLQFLHGNISNEFNSLINSL